MSWLVLVVFVFGANFTLWGTIGLLRLVDGGLRPIDLPDHSEVDGPDPDSLTTRLIGPVRGRCPVARSTVYLNAVAHRRVFPGRVYPSRNRSITLDQVAVLMPAHNEEPVIRDSLAAIAQLIPRANIHVVSDGSTDRTVEYARGAGVHVTETPSNVGKAAALQHGVRHFRLVERFRAVLLLDADTHVEPGYFPAALPLFDDPEVVAVAGCVRTRWRPAELSRLGRMLVAHRERIYSITQRLMKYGQTWRTTNATHIVPGFASLYRTEVLPDIDMNPPGLVIEDFNMTFEVYRRRLGKVGFSLDAVATTQDPDNLRDYVKQTKRWALGFWQTVRRHGLRPNFFSVVLALLMAELVSSSLLFLILPLLVLVLAVPVLVPGTLDWPGASALYQAVHAHVTLTNMAFGVLLPDLALTGLVALLQRRPRYLLYAPFYLLLRVLDAAVGLYSLPRAWLERSTGRWVSPTRRRTSPTDIPGLAGVPGLSTVSGRIVAPRMPAEQVPAEHLVTVNLATVPEQLRPPATPLSRR